MPTASSPPHTVEALLRIVEERDCEVVFLKRMVDKLTLQLLRARRSEDRSSDLWTTFNRVQENTIKGGLSGRNKQGRRTTTRAVNGIDQDVKLNRALWVLAQALRTQQAA